MSTIAKFYVGRIATVEAEEAWYGGQITATRRHDIRLNPVSSGSKENELFFRWTPSGTIVLESKDRAFAEQFKAKAEFYVTFDKVEGEDPAVVPADAHAFRIVAIGNEHGTEKLTEKLYTVKLRMVNQTADASGTIELGTINEAAAREFLGFGIVAVRFKLASG